MPEIWLAFDTLHNVLPSSKYSEYGIEQCDVSMAGFLIYSQEYKKSIMRRFIPALEVHMNIRREVSMHLGRRNRNE